ncbi:MAG: hypothetical protein ABFQ62_02760 [Patescibacteria group bacterium]
MPIQLVERLAYREESIKAMALSLGRDISQIWVNPVTGELSLRQIDRVDREHADLGFELESQET